MVIGEEMSMTEIARRVGCHLTHISRILNGERTPSLAMAVKIASVMGITIEQLWDRIQEVKN